MHNFQKEAEEELIIQNDPSLLNEALYDEIKVGDRKYYHCLAPHCEKIFRFRFEINRHSRVHSNLRPFKCDAPDCGRAFKRSDALISHKKTHSIRTFFNCPIQDCPSHFSSKSALKIHLKKHQSRNNTKSVCSSNQEGSNCINEADEQIKSHTSTAAVSLSQKSSNDFSYDVFDDQYQTTNDAFEFDFLINRDNLDYYLHPEDFENIAEIRDQPVKLLKTESIALEQSDLNLTKPKSKEHVLIMDPTETVNYESLERASNDDLREMISALAHENSLLKDKLKSKTSTKDDIFIDVSKEDDQGALNQPNILPFTLEDFIYELRYDFLPFALENNPKDDLSYD